MMATPHGTAERPRFPSAADRSAGSWSHGPLTRHQKANLSILARRAYEERRAANPGMDADTWRRDQSIAACGKRITEATQGDYLRLRAHFEDLCGEPDRAMRTMWEEDNQATKVAFRRLCIECKQRGLDLNYPGVICKKQFHCSLKEATAKQLWCLIFTIRNRRNAGGAPKRRKSFVEQHGDSNIPF